MNEWEEIASIIAKKKKREVLFALEHGSKTQKMISSATGLRAEHVSRHIKDLIEQGLIIDLTPNVIRMKIYQLTEDGQRIIDKIRELESSGNDQG